MYSYRWIIIIHTIVCLYLYNSPVKLDKIIAESSKQWIFSRNCYLQLKEHLVKFFQQIRGALAAYISVIYSI